MRSRASATPSDGNDDDRKPFRPRTTSRSPNPAKLPTPPREVILTPRATPKPVKRRAASQIKRPATRVKTEPPEIDLSKVRPPSPSDDPLLLSGARTTRSPPLRARLTPTFSSSDDDDEFNLTGDYTGKYKLLRVPTKADPLTSRTADRMESWGRPVSPFPYSEIMERSLPDDAGGPADMFDPMLPSEDVDMWEVATEPPLSDAEPSPQLPLLEDEFLEDDLPICDEGEEEEEAQVDRELSVCVDDGPIGPVEGHSSDEEDDVEGEDIIKVTSDDPKAAARAAAILRMHDYDCILAAEKKRSRSTKSKQRRRKPIENTSFSMSYCDSSFTLSPLKAMTTCPETQLSPPTGEWTRDYWKCLDKCLAAERLAASVACGLGATDSNDISKDAVLDRFVNQLGGESVLAGLGPQWSRDNLILRLDVLIKRQSRRGTRATSQDSFSTTELRYSGLLQEAMALSGTMERCPTSVSILSDTSVVSEPLRGPIKTPSRSPCPMPPHPKDQIHLRHALPQKSMIPVPIRPKRLVDLRHLSPTKSDGGERRPAGRRSSGCSVKDLVKQFENLDK